MHEEDGAGMAVMASLQDISWKEKDFVSEMDTKSFWIVVLQSSLAGLRPSQRIVSITD